MICGELVQEVDVGDKLNTYQVFRLQEIEMDKAVALVEIVTSSLDYLAQQQR